jgi:hypothetical protein
VRPALPSQSTSDLAVDVTLDFLAHFGLIDAAPDRSPASRRNAASSCCRRT